MSGDTEKKGKLRPEKMKKLLRRVLIILGISVAAAYIAGIFVLMGRFLENTSVNGIPVSHLAAEEAEALYRKSYDGWQLTLRTLEGREEIITQEEIGYALAPEPTFPEMVRRQNYLKWPLTPFLPTEIRTEGTAVFDEEKLKAAVRGLDCISGDGIRPPTDARIERAENGGFYELIEADDGNTLDFDRTIEAVAEAIRAGKSELDLAGAQCYRTASVYASDETLQARFALIDAFQSTVISINMEGGVTELLTKEIYGSWLDYNMETGEIQVSSDAAYAYAVSLYDRYSTFGHKRKFKANAGDIVEVGGSRWDCFGYEMDLDTTAASIRDALLAGVSGSVDCTWTQLGLARDELGGDFGNTYIEISLDEQRLWYYIDGELIVSTGIVSGLATRSRATPCGCFMVLDKLLDHTMQGTYGQAYAKYVIAIMFNGICIHDSSWRDEYGGDIWLYDGSHGCINTPYQAVETLYNNVWTGVPVIIYDRADTVPEVDNELYSGTDAEIAGDYESHADDSADGGQ